jgi:hypothetical protein
MSSTNKIMSQDVQPVDQRDSDFPHGGKDSTVTFDTSDPANDHAWTINQDTPDTPPGVKSDSTPV